MNGTAESPSYTFAPRPARTWMHAFGVVLLMRVAAAGLAFAVTAMLGRQLGDALLGRLGLLLATMDVAAGLVGPALDTTLVRFAARHIGPGRDASLAYFQRMFRLKLVVAVGLLAGGAVLARPILRYVIAPSAGTVIGPGGVVLAFAGAAVLSLMGFAQAYYQAHFQMARYAFIELANSLLRLMVVGGLLALLGQPSASLLLGAFVASSALAAAGGLARLPGAVFHKTTDDAVSLRAALGFAKWVALAAVATTLAQRADVFILGLTGTSGPAIGQYVAAFTVARLGDLAIMTLFSVLLPRASALTAPDEFRRFLNRLLPLVLAAFAAGLPTFFASRWAVTLVFGASFAPAGLLCGILCLGVLASFGAAPAGAALYGMGRSREVAVLEMSKLIAVAALGAFSARQFGVAGMAWTVSAVRATIGIATYLCAYRGARLYAQESVARGDYAL